ncbi:MAG: acetoacetate--CoA ligase [Candidatus Nanopelagicales bacterium]
MAEQGHLLWTPEGDDTLMQRFCERAGVPDSVALHEWSVSEPDAFWDLVWQECGVVGTRGTGPAVTRGSDLRGDRYFPDATLDYAENLLAGGTRPGARPEAIISLREDGRRSTLTWEELAERTAACQDWLVSMGVGPGDHVAAWMPNLPETVIAMLATIGLGGVFTSTSPDFGVAGVVDRFSQVDPVVLITADGYHYGGRIHDRTHLLADVLAQLPTVRAVALVDEIGAEVPDVGVPVVRWGDGWRAAGPVRTRREPVATAGFVLYSSGTTGRPKCIVHSASGILLKQLTEHQLHCDIRPGDRVFYFTTCGWMMWNWLVTALASGATIALFDGSPFHPGPEAMWDVVAAEGVTLFGTSAKFLDSSAKAGMTPGRTHDLSTLRTITSTGSPLSAEGFDFVYRDVDPQVHLASISGGTDLCGCFVIGDPTRPVYAGEIQGPALGADVDVLDAAGNSLRASPGERGELVCRSSFPSMPLRFAGDSDGSRYTAAYFERFPGLWAHGDFASWTEHGGLVIHGRSDATLNAGGVRIGTAEIYRQVEQLPEVAEALAVGQEWDDDTRIVLFVRPADPGLTVDGPVPAPDDVADRIRRRLRVECSPRHVPARIVMVPDLPRTRSGKLAELAVADVVHGRPVRNTEGLANADTLDLFIDLPSLQT